MTTKTVYDSNIIDPTTRAPVPLLATLSNDGVTWTVTTNASGGTTKTVYDLRIIDPATNAPVPLLATLNSDNTTWSLTTG